MFRSLFAIALLHASFAWAEDSNRIIIQAPPKEAAPGETTIETGGRSYFETVRAPSFVSARSGGKGESPQFIVRGLDPIQNRMFLEGVPLNEGQFQFGDLTQIPETLIGSVELHADDVPTKFLEDGMGGALHLRFPKKRAPSVSLEGGSYTYAEGAGTVGSQTLGLSANYRQAKEDYIYFDNNGTPLTSADDRLERRSNNGFRRGAVLPAATLYRTRTTRLNLWNLSFFGDQSVAGPTFQVSTTQVQRASSLTALNFETKGEQTRLEGVAYGRFLRIESRGNDLSRIWPSTQTQAGALVGARASVTQRLGNLRLQATAGGKFENFGRTLGNVQGRQEQFRRDLPAAVSLRYRNSRWDARVSTMFQNVRYQGDSSLVIPQMKTGSVTRELSVISPRASLVFKPAKGARLRLSGARVFRHPSFFELFGGPGGVQPNTELTSEAGWKLALGSDLSGEFLGSKRARFSATIAAAKLTDQISYVQNSQSSYIADNLGASDIVTGELSGHWERGPLKLDVSWTVMSAWNRTPGFQNGKRIPFRPDNRWNGQVQWREKRWGVGYRVSVSGERFIDLANTRRLSPAWEHSLFAQWDPGLGKIEFEFQNMSDALRSESTFRSSSDLILDNATGFPGYPAPGRRLYLKWSVPL